MPDKPITDHDNPTQETRIDRPTPCEQPARRGASLMRTRRLIMAAVRVWELKRGLRD